MFRCKVCGWLHAGDVPPDRCPSCGSPSDRFRPVASGLAETIPSAASLATDARIRLLALVPATIASPFARHDGPRLDVATGDSAWFDDNIPCMRACPVNTDVATYIGHVAGGAFDLAAQLNRDQNVFAGTLGRTCSRPCEDACRRVVIDGPIQIRALKRVATDRATTDTADPSRPEPSTERPIRPTGHQVAVVGAGVAGLTVGRELRASGHAVTIYERDAEPGGLMRSGVPAWRLPRDVVATDIKTITALGVTVQSGVSLGRDLTIAYLSGHFDAVVVATGTQRVTRIDDDAEFAGRDPIRGLTDGLAFLRHAANGGQRPTGTVAVVGGGYTAFDCARTARRLAAGSVSIAMRNPVSESVTADEFDAAIAEGITIEQGVSVVAVEREGNAVVGITLEDEAGSRRTLPCSLVIAALGQHPDLSVIDVPDSADATGSVLGASGQFGGWPNVWLAGDVGSGSSSFIDAIAFAKRTAATVDRWLGSQRHEGATPQPAASPESAPIPLDGAENATGGGTAEDASVPVWTRDLLHRRVIEDEPYRSIPVQPTQALRPADRGLGSGDATIEADGGLSAEIGQKEAARCLQCQANIFIDGDRCILCNGCVDICPYGCIEMVGLDRLATVDGLVRDDLGREPGHRVAMLIDEDSCIRCGKCVDWCPTSCITMTAHRPTIGGEPSGFDLRSLLAES